MHNHAAVLLIAHGSRRSEANDDLTIVAERVRESGNYQCVEIAYLELVEPTIPQAAAACVQQTPHKVIMLPYFLSAGRHVNDHLEQHRRDLAAEHPDVNFVLCPPLGHHPKIVEVVLERLAQEG